MRPPKERLVVAANSSRTHARQKSGLPTLLTLERRKVSPAAYSFRQLCPPPTPIYLSFDYAAEVGARRASCYCWPSLFPPAECRSDGLRGAGSRVIEELGQVQAAVTDLVLQGGSKLIDVSGCNVYSRAILEK
jgi:hypothetical protein